LDAISVQNLHQIILQAKKNGTTIVLTTHYLHEAELLCDHLIVIDHGQKVASGTVADVIAQGRKMAPKAHIASLEDAYITLIEGSAGHA
jgi:ABC-2 type transport system ATP-binding protein